MEEKKEGAVVMLERGLGKASPLLDVAARIDVLGADQDAVGGYRRRCPGHPLFES